MTADTPSDDEPMLVDVGKLGDVNRRAKEGAENATRNLKQMADVEASVAVTKINLISLDHLNRRFTDGDYVVVSIGLDGHLEGDLVTVFRRESARRIAGQLLGEDGPTAIDEMGESALKEIVNIMTSGFIDGWADEEGTSIDMTPPEIVVRDEREPVFEERFARGTAGTDQVLHLRSEVTTNGETVDFGFYMFLDQSSLDRVVGSSGGDDVLNLDRLLMLKRVAQTSSDTIVDDLEQMTGIETGVKVTHLDFIPIQDLARQETDEPAAGTVLTFEEDPSGFLVILFDEGTANGIAEALLGDGSDDATEFTVEDRSAIEEIGNIMASGFIDGWADALGRTIDISTPEFVHDLRQSILTDATVRMASDQEFILCFRTTIDAMDREFECDIYNVVNVRDLHGNL